jgi:hypothetical protein
VGDRDALALWERDEESSRGDAERTPVGVTLIGGAVSDAARAVALLLVGVTLAEALLGTGLAEDNVESWLDV